MNKKVTELLISILFRWGSDLQNSRIRFQNRVVISQWNELSEEEWFWPQNSWVNVDLKPLLKPFFHHYVTRVVPYLWQNFLISKKYLTDKKPKAIGYGVWEPKDIGLLMAGKDLKIPRIMYQHGGSIADVENLGVIYNDHFLSDFELVYGPDHEEYIGSKQWYPKYKTIIIAVGDARLESLKMRLTPDVACSIKTKICGPTNKKLILYVPGSIFTNFFRYSCYNIRNNYTFKIRKTIFDFIDAYDSSIQFIYKPMITSYDDPTCDMIRQHYPHVQIVQNIPLPELQSASDLVIQEVPSSAMYETMITDRPMIVLVDKHIWNMPDEIHRLLSKRAHVATDNNEFISLIQNAVNDLQLWTKPNADKEFWERFCVPYEGKSAELASEKIHQIIQSWNYV